MFGFLFKKIFGSKNERYLRRLRPQVQRINALEEQMRALEDADLPARIVQYKTAVQEQGQSLDALLPEVFALVREAARRVLGMRHYDVQLVGGMVLHKGKIAEMKTGEGKTLVATMPAYLNALTGKVEGWERLRSGAAEDTVEAASASENSVTSSAAGSNLPELIDVQAAKLTAYSHAGIAEKDAQSVKSALRLDGLKLVYEIQFSADKYAYDYTVDAVSGDIVSSAKNAK